MTATMPERPTTAELRPSADIWPATIDLGKLTADILEVLCAHGLGDVKTVKVDVTPIQQGDYYTGLSISGMVYERPAELGAGMTRDEYYAAMRGRS